ncbi:MAG: hypothetical protein A3F04_00145 [Candidatus Chisholmbacteria bacterium RIFCSPHIGHO2_12_FULL_49_9]|uniref:Uncharacterized protein n=1 Tax=Candidatus Chisholmbacteria bacterium RIFCSPHIGHO2_01_FULL_52_32 TaxID=1797591 RepID=A0A1G1VS98_9BACT|nr:MAG: hypothetical protein A2786_01985 [Candidatus Chisholmbacteria bacterium RIFCSPHIGHO2_01_FULL_52_32]OGY19126.1 MAG: hypothetical protein A3F04_00145 [Candidatus Chisholmbacteria bacterium RIFCSPHIGHO2_12_FULL_49_9]OGY20358.1 MAG: hypothetical protein A2900_04760 [Candidatus Chisholmbacteria bacterium RIFCSPLOWO2_01_FULL_50_28]
MTSKESDLSPQEKEFVRETIRRAASMARHDAYGNAIMDLAESLGKNPLQQVELTLRELGLGVYIIAVPVEGVGDFEARTFDIKERCRYSFAIIEGDAEGAWIKMAENGTTPEENLANLAQAGVLVPVPGTGYARMIHAKDN